MTPIRGCSALEVLQMVTLSASTNDKCRWNHQHEVMMWGEEKEGRLEQWGVVGSDKKPLQSIKEKKMQLLD